jgi:hypothetical protein
MTGYEKVLLAVFVFDGNKVATIDAIGSVMTAADKGAGAAVDTLSNINQET